MDEHGDWTQKNEVMDLIFDLLRYSYIGIYIALLSKSHSWVIPSWNYNIWLVVEPYPSEKWWSSSAGIVTFPNWMESHKIHLTYMDYQYMIGFLIYNRHPITLYHWIFQMFQSPPTSFRTNKPILRFVDLDFTHEKCWDVRRKSAPSPSPSAGEGQSGGRLCQWPG